MDKIKFVILAPIILGIGLLIGGIVSSVQPLMYAGIAVLFGGSFLCALITTIVVVVKSVRDTDTKPNSTPRTREERALDEVKSAARVYKNAPDSDKVKGCIFVIAFLVCLFGGMALMVFGLYIPGGIVFGCAFLLIISMAIISTIPQRRSLSRHYKPEDYIKKQAEVVHCNIASTTSVNGRITKVVYRVAVKFDGVVKDAFSLVEYNVGTVLEVLVHKNGKTVKITDNVISNGEDYDDYGDDDEFKPVRKKSYDDYDEPEDGSEDDPDDEFESEPVAEPERKRADKLDEMLAEKQAIMPEPTDVVDDGGASVNDVDTEVVKAPESVDEVAAPNGKKPNVGYKGINRKK